MPREYDYILRVASRFGVLPVCNRRTPPDGFAEQNGRDAERAD